VNSHNNVVTDIELTLPHKLEAPEESLETQGWNQTGRNVPPRVLSWKSQRESTHGKQQTKICQITASIVGSFCTLVRSGTLKQIDKKNPEGSGLLEKPCDGVKQSVTHTTESLGAIGFSEKIS
jgi:hypothetical protein